MRNKQNDPLGTMREQLKRAIEKDYETVEAFCWDKNLNKATISNFLRSKKDFRISTLVQIAQALGMDLTIKLD